jgi:hypothetical protein
VAGFIGVAMTIDERLARIEMDLYDRKNPLRKAARIIAEKTIFALVGIMINYFIQSIV